MAKKATPKKPAKKALAKKPPAPPAPVAKKKRKRRKKTFRDKGGRRWWSDDERALILAALSASGGDIPGTAERHGVPYTTLYCWHKGWRCPEAMQLRSDRAGDLADAAEEVAWQLITLMPQAADRAPLNHLASSFGTLVNNQRLLREQSTSNARVERVRTATPPNLDRLTPDEREVFTRLCDVLTRRDEPADAGRVGGSGGGDGEAVRALPPSPLLG